eukprot:14256416-Alexandrium_andersonii.AAC.1
MPRSPWHRLANLTVSSQSMLKKRNLVRFRHRAPNWHWSRTCTTPLNRETKHCSSGVCHMRELMGCSKMHGTPLLHSHRNNFSADRKSRLPRSSRARCFSLSSSAGSPQGLLLARIAPAGPLSAAMPQEEHGGPSIAPSTSPRWMLRPTPSEHPGAQQVAFRPALHVEEASVGPHLDG